MTFIPASNVEAIEALYIGYFGRAGEPGGVAYWVQRMSEGMTFAQVAASFSEQPEAKGQHSFLANPTTQDPAAFVRSLYEQLLERSPVGGEANYWIEKLQSSSGNPLAIGLLIAQFISGADAANGDAAVLAAKVEGAVFATEQLENAGISGVDSAGQVLANIDKFLSDLIGSIEDDSSLADAKELSEVFAQNGGSLPTTPPPVNGPNPPAGGPDPMSADAPIVVAQDISVLNFSSGLQSSLAITVSLADPTETLGPVLISGIPDGFRLSAGIQGDDGVWIVQPGQLAGLKLVHVSGVVPSQTFVIGVSATSLSSSDSATTSVEFEVSITNSNTFRAVDGYIFGADVFGVIAGTETSLPIATTNADGTFQGSAIYDSYVVRGGVDVSTGLSLVGELRAPAGSSIVSPLTTLLYDLEQSGLSASQAAAALSTAFGFSSSIDVRTFDPVAEARTTGDATAFAVLAAGVQIQATAAQLATISGGSASGVVSSLAVAISAGGSISFADAISEVIDVIVPSANQQAAEDILAATNGAIAASLLEGTNAGKFERIAQSAVVTMSETTQDDIEAALTNGDLEDFADSYNSGLEAEIDSAEVEDADGAQLGGSGNDILVGGEFDDLIDGGAGRDDLDGGRGNDTIIGGTQQDRAKYNNVAGHIEVQLSSGIVRVFDQQGQLVETDTLRQVEVILGSDGDDYFNSVGFSDNRASNANQGSILPNGNVSSTFNGGRGNDTIDGDARTMLSYGTSESAVFVNFTGNAVSGVLARTAYGVDSGTDTFNSEVRWAHGSRFNDTFIGNSVSNFFVGAGGDDYLDGGGEFDIAAYSTNFGDSATGGVSINMAAGIVQGNASVGRDTLRSIEGVRGTFFADTYDARGLGSQGAANITNYGGFSDFEGSGGDDVIYSNGQVRVSYISSLEGVVVDLVAQTGGGNASVGNDILLGTNDGSASAITNVRGSTHNDILTGSDRNETFDGWNGNDLINGGGGFDRATYDLSPLVQSGIVVQLAAGTVTGDAGVGNDTLLRIEEIRGTFFADRYDATGFSGMSANAGDFGTFNSFQGYGGNDVVIGNGNTRIIYIEATAGISADLATGVVQGDASVGTDTVSGISRVAGSRHDDLINLGSTGIRARGDIGADQITLGSANNQVEYGSGAESNSASMDIIFNFDADHDQFRFSDSFAIDPISSFTFIGAAAFSGGAREIRLETNANGTFMQVDYNRDGQAELEVKFVGLTGSLGLEDFALV